MIDLFNVLLSKAIIKTATTSSVDEAYNIAARIHQRSVYIFKVLQAPIGIRVAVRNLAKASDSPGQTQLAAILTVFEALSAAEKAAFLRTFKVCTSMVGGAMGNIALRNTWQWNHVPPIYNP